MKRWNYWVPRALAALAAVGIIGASVPWASLENYLFLPVSVLRIFAIPWLFGVHCLAYKRLRLLAWLSLSGAALILVSTFVAFAIEGPAHADFRPMLHDTTVQLTGLAYMFVIVSLLLFQRLRGVPQTIQHLTALAVVAELISYWGDLWLPREWRAAGWIVHGCIGLSAYVGLFVTTYYLLAFREPLEAYIPVHDAADRVKFECPRCMKLQELPLGQSACPDCGIGIHIEIEEPQCAKCGYNLRGLPQKVCPECGTPFGVEPAST